MNQNLDFGFDKQIIQIKAIAISRNLNNNCIHFL